MSVEICYFSWTLKSISWVLVANEVMESSQKWKENERENVSKFQEWTPTEDLFLI